MYKPERPAARSTAEGLSKTIKIMALPYVPIIVKNSWWKNTSSDRTRLFVVTERYGEPGENGVIVPHTVVLLEAGKMEPEYRKWSEMVEWVENQILVEVRPEQVDRLGVVLKRYW